MPLYLFIYFISNLPLLTFHLHVYVYVRIDFSFQRTLMCVSFTDEVKCVRRIASVNKLSQQRYNSEDLYKPRPILSQRSRRRGMDTII